MYRDGQTAEIESLRNDVARTEAARSELLRQQDALRAELHRLKEGVEPDATLGDHTPYRRMQRVLLALAVVASIALTLGLQRVLAWAVADPLLTTQGLRNFGWSVMHGRGAVGIAATGFALVVTMPWVLLPVLGRKGLKGDHRWGWLSAVAGAALFVPTPLMPLAVFALSVLFSRRVRGVYFPTR
jgi:hypothetical protein